jgi:hypothetical protein
MSSLTRRIQISALKKANKGKLFVATDNGTVIGRKWATRPHQLFFLADLTPVFPETKHKKLQAVIDALSPKPS